MKKKYTLSTIHLSADGFNLFKHALDGQISMMPCYISPIFMKKEIRNEHVQLLGLYPGPKQDNIDMYGEIWYKELSLLREPFYETVGGKRYSFNVVFVMYSGDCKHMPDITKHKQLPSVTPGHTSKFEGNIPPTLFKKIAPVKKKKRNKIKAKKGNTVEEKVEGDYK
jgi:hypothetical protein